MRGVNNVNLFVLQVSSEHADRAISFVAKDEKRRINVEGHAPDDLHRKVQST
jgi:hypothetical protein